jgi:hypothetical protein
MDNLLYQFWPNLHPIQRPQIFPAYQARGSFFNLDTSAWEIGQVPAEICDKYEIEIAS